MPHDIHTTMVSSGIAFTETNESIRSSHGKSNIPIAPLIRTMVPSKKVKPCLLQVKALTMPTTFTTLQSLENGSGTERITSDLPPNLDQAGYSTNPMEKFFQNNNILYIHSAILILINVISIISNIIVTYLFATHKQLRTRPNIIVMSLTSSDLLYAIIMFSFSVMTKTIRRGEATFTCVLVNFALINVSVTVSGWSLVALTVERYLSIHTPFQNRGSILKSNYLLTVVGIWCFGIISTGLMLIPWHKDNMTKTILCGGLVQYTTFTTCLTVLLQAILPITIIAILYSLIARTAKRHRQAINNLEMQVLKIQSPSNSPQPSVRNRQKSWFRYTVRVAKGTKVLLFACLSLILTWSPIFIVLQLFVFCTNCHKETRYYLFLFGSVLFHSKGFINPLTFTLRDTQFKHAASKTISRVQAAWKERCSHGKA